MRILADENISRAIVLAIRLLEHEVVWITETNPGIPDSAVAEIAVTDCDLLLTFDKNLASAVARSKICGVMLLRLDGTSAKQAASKVVQLLLDIPKLSKSYVVVSDNGMRVRAFDH